MDLMLFRTYTSEGTNGEIFNGAEHICSTIELPWRSNTPKLSCIPEGRYELGLRFSPRFLEHLLIKNVKDRKFILMHPANDALRELRGCIAPVMELTGPGKGIGSGFALHKIMQIVKEIISKGEKVMLNILNTEAELCL